MRRFQKNKSTVQRQECLSVSDMTVQHENQKSKMHEYYKNIKEDEPARYEEIKEHKRINFMKSIASSIDHEKQNEKNQLNDQNQVGSLCHEKHLKQMSEYSTNQRNSSKISVDQKLIIFKELINEGLLHICVVCQRCFYKKFVFFYDENKFKSQISNFNLVRSFNSNLHICRTCCIKCQKGKVLCQAVSNKLEVFDLPVEFQSI